MSASGLGHLVSDDSGKSFIVPMYLPWSLRAARWALERLGFFLGGLPPAATVAMSGTSVRIGAMRENVVRAGGMTCGSNVTPWRVRWMIFA